MKSYIRIVPFASAIVILAAALLNGEDAGAIPQTGLTVHEWGTFTSVAGEDGTTVDWQVLSGKDDLPQFVNDRGYRCFKFSLSASVRMETPVLYFYSARALDAHVRVAFPQGLITEWYPQADYQVDQRSVLSGVVRRLEPNLNGIDALLRNLTGGIEWKNVKVEPNTTPVLPRDFSPSHYYAARAVDAAPVTVGNQHEKFLFYRGVGRFEVPLSARLSADGKVILANDGSDPVPMVLLFENRGGSVGYRNAGAVSASATLDRPSLDGSLPQLYSDLKDALVAQGLFRKEADAMVETWKDSWFEEGSRLIYIVPARTVDAILPLQVDPVPSQTARVFVGRIELITPEIIQTVKDAVVANDRSVADTYGRFLDAILKRVPRDNTTSAIQIERFYERARIPFDARAARCQ